jgi:hypothetical protein
MKERTISELFPALVAIAISDTGTFPASGFMTMFFDCARTTDFGKIAIPAPAAISAIRGIHLAGLLHDIWTETLF